MKALAERARQEAGVPQEKCREDEWSRVAEASDHELSQMSAVSILNGSYGVSFQSILSPSAVTTGVQSATSAARDCRNFSGVESRIGSKPVSISICW